MISSSGGDGFATVGLAAAARPAASSAMGGNATHAVTRPRWAQAARNEYE
jgi:hypothetical protein